VQAIGSRNIRKLERRGVSGRAFIVGEHAAQAASAQDRSLSVFEAGGRKNEYIADALMISLGMVIRDELPRHVSEQAPSKQDHLFQAADLGWYAQTFLRSNSGSGRVAEALRIWVPAPASVETNSAVNSGSRSWIR